MVDGLGFIMEMIQLLTFMAKGHLEHCLWPFIIVNWKAFSHFTLNLIYVEEWHKVHVPIEVYFHAKIINLA